MDLLASFLTSLLENKVLITTTSNSTYTGILVEFDEQNILLKDVNERSAAVSLISSEMLFRIGSIASLAPLEHSEEV